MLKKIVFVLLSALILSSVCFAQQESAKEQMKDTTSAVTQEQPAAVTQEQPATVTQEQPATVTQEQPAAVAQEPPALVLEEIQICTGVEYRQPIGAAPVFPDDLDKLYCFTKIGGADRTTYVDHVWYFGDDEVARVKLPVKSNPWRTWSSKKLYKGLSKGHVEIVSENGDVLGQAEFEIQPVEKAEEVGKPEKTGITEEAPEAPKEQ
jgi:Protein of unknown function (DUF2914)